MTVSQYLRPSVDHNAAEQTVNNSNFRTLFKAMPGACIITSHDGTVQEVNPEGEVFLARSVDDCRGINISEIFFNNSIIDQLSVGPSVIIGSSKSLSKFEATCKYRESDAVDVNVSAHSLDDPDGLHNSILWIIQDFSMRSEMKHNGSKVAGLLSEKINSSGAAFISVDGNSTYELTSMLGDTAELQEKCMRAFKGEFFRFETIVQDEQGSSTTYEVSLGPRSDAGSAPIQIFALIIDVSKEAESHYDLFRNRAALAEVQRMSLVGGIAAGLTHEMAQPLAAIGGYAAGGVRRLQSGSTNHNDLVVLLQKINKQVERAGNTLRLMCDFSQKRNDQLGWFDANRLVEETCNIMKHELRIKNANIDYNLADEIPQIWGDRAQIQQVLVNLIQNSVEAFDVQKDIDGEVMITSEVQEAGGLNVIVVDNGPGLDEDLVSNAFAPFYTRKPGSAGMGLTICETIIDSHEGKIWIESSGPGGAKVSFFLPRAASSDGAIEGQASQLDSGI